MLERKHEPKCQGQMLPFEPLERRDTDMSRDILFLDKESITTGVLRRPGLGYVITTLDSDALDRDRPHSLMRTLYMGKWGAYATNWLACSGTVCHIPAERFLAIGEWGFVYVIGGGEERVENSIQDGGFSPQTRGPLREVRAVNGGRAYAVGTKRQVYRRDAADRWVCIDQSMQRLADNMEDYCFESIDGFSEEDIYAVGWEGEIWHFDGRLWERIESPTNLALYKIRCGKDGFAYACGQAGTLLRGRGVRWEVIQQQRTEEDLWGLEWFMGRLYVASTQFVYYLDADDLELVDFADDVPSSCYHLSAIDDVLWSIGPKDLMEFNGIDWTRVL